MIADAELDRILVAWISEGGAERAPSRHSRGSRHRRGHAGRGAPDRLPAGCAPSPTSGTRGGTDLSSLVIALLLAVAAIGVGTTIVELTPENHGGATPSDPRPALIASPRLHAGGRPRRPCRHRRGARLERGSPMSWPVSGADPRGVGRGPAAACSTASPRSGFDSFGNGRLADHLRPVERRTLRGCQPHDCRTNSGSSRSMDIERSPRRRHARLSGDARFRRDRRSGSSPLASNGSLGPDGRQRSSRYRRLRLP